MGTSVAYGGTVGKATRTSGKYADVSASVEAIKNIDGKLQALEDNGKLTADNEAAAAESIRKNYENIEKALKSTSEKRRADIIKRNRLESAFEADGTLKADISQALDNRINKADTGIRGDYYSVNARGKESVISRDLKAISDKLVEEYAKNNNVSIEEARTAVGEIKAYSGELSDTGRQNLVKTKKALNALNKMGNSGVSVIVMDNVAKDGDITTNGTIIGDRIYMTADTFENGKWAQTLVHEYTHFEEGTEEYKRLVSHLLEDKALFESADAEVRKANYSTDEDTYVSEVSAKMSESLLGNEHFINKLVRQDASLAGKVIDKIKALKETLSSMTDAQARAEHKRLVKAENLYLKAAEAAGNYALVKKIRGGEKKEEKRNYDEQSGVQTELNDETVNSDSSRKLVHFSKNKNYTPDDSVKAQTREHLLELNDIEPVANLNYKVISKEMARKDALTLYKTFGFAIDRYNFGIIHLGKNEIQDSVRYLNTPAEFAAWMCVPQVLKRGKIIDSHANHKGEGFPTYTIAAPVILNGQRGNVSVVVKETGKLRYKMHRILMPDGSTFLYSDVKEKAESTVSDVSLVKKRKGPDIDSATNSIPDSSEKSNSFSEKSEKIQMSRSASSENTTKKITAEMSDAERAKILSKKQVIAPVYTGQADATILANKDAFEQKRMDIVKTVIATLGDEFGLVGGQISFEDVDIEVTLSKTNFRESTTKQATPAQLAKLIPVLKPAAQKAVGVERHDNRYFFDNDTVYFDNLLGGYIDGEDFVPVRFGLKHSRTGNTVLYVVIDQNKIPVSNLTEIKNDTGHQDAKSDLTEVGGPRRRVTYSIAQIIQFVNSGDALRYLPDKMLSEEQKVTKWKAVAETAKYTAEKNDKKYFDYIKNGNLRDARRMIVAAAKAAGYTIHAYHGSDAKFNVFEQSKEGPLGEGVYFAESREYAQGVAPNGMLYDVFLRITNPFEAKYPGGISQEYLIAQGYDGVHHEGNGVWVAFEPSQAKSAETITYDDEGNIIPLSKRFDTQKSDIRFSRTKSSPKTVENYTEEQYNNFGWVRGNDVLNEGQKKDFDTKFSQAINGYKTFRKTKSGEYMIPVSDIYDSNAEGINNVIVYAKGTMEMPVITRILEIDEYDETNLSEIRSHVYAIEREGFRQTTGGVFSTYTRFNFRDYATFERNFAQNAGHNNQLGAGRGTGSGTVAKSQSGVRSPYLKVVHTFTDVAGKKRNVIRISDNQFMIEGDYRSKYQPTIEAAVNAENERVIDRYARKKDKSKSFVIAKLAANPDFLKDSGPKFSRTATTQGRVDEKRADIEVLRTYERKDAEKIADIIYEDVLTYGEGEGKDLHAAGYDASFKNRKEITKFLYSKLNSARSEKDIKAVAEEITDYILKKTMLTDFINEPNAEAHKEIYIYLKSLKNNLNLDNIEAEIKQHFDSSSAEVLKYWRKKSGGIKVYELIPQINERFSGHAGFPIDASASEADVFFALCDAYEKAKRASQEKISTSMKDVFDNDNVADLKATIEAELKRL